MSRNIGNVGINDTTPSGALDIDTNVADTLVVTNGNVGIRTATPGQTLHVVGTANISATLNAPVINTTLSTQNLTLSSGGGSVIIRLG